MYYNSEKENNESIKDGANMSLALSRKAQAVKPSSTLSITAKAKELKEKGIDVVGFGAGEPDFNTPENICGAAIKAINSGFTKYTPAEGTLELRKAVCEKFLKFNNIKYEPNQVVISNGGKHSLTNIFAAILNPGDEVIIPSPYWLSYPEIIKLSDGIPVFIRAGKEQNYKVTAEQIEAACTDKTKALIINSPNNPTGMIYTRKELEAIAEVAVKKDFYVVSDEIYENLIYGDDHSFSIASLNDEIYKRTITCNGVAKSYSMTGWRIGYTGSSREIAKLMGSVQSHQTSNPNSIAQKAAYEALAGPQDFIFTMNEEFNKRRDYMFERVSKMKLVSAVKPQGAFYLFIDVSQSLNKEYNSTKVENLSNLAKFLIEDFNVAVVPCDDFGFPDHIRLSYAISIKEIEKGMDRMNAFFNKLT